MLRFRRYWTLQMLTCVDLRRALFKSLHQYSRKRTSQPGSGAPLKENSDNQHQDKTNDIIQSNKKYFYN